MRLVQVTIPTGKREAVLAALDDEEVDYVVSDETSSQEWVAIAYVPLPTKAVEPVLESLREAGLDDDAFTVVLEAETVVSRRFDALQERYAEEDGDERIAREELVAAAASLAPSGWYFVALTVLSAVIATAGLLLNSAAVVVGSMVIAPLVGPALTASVGTVVDDQDLFRQGVSRQLLGVGLAVAAATVFAVALRYGPLIAPITDPTDIGEISERVAPDVLSLAIGLGAGAAGIISLTTGVSTALVGVMIAAALIPPAATVGIGIAWGMPMIALGSGVLVAVNVISINLAALLVLWYSGYRPKNWFRTDEARRSTLVRVATLATVIVVLTGFLGGVTFDSLQRASTEERIQEAAEEHVGALNSSLDDVPISLLDVEVHQTNTAIFQRTDEVVITVGHPPGRAVSGLGEDLDARIQGITGYNVTVRVDYVTTEMG